jgi:hypothetical protein
VAASKIVGEKGEKRPNGAFYEAAPISSVNKGFFASGIKTKQVTCMDKGFFRFQAEPVTVVNKGFFSNYTSGFGG